MSATAAASWPADFFAARRSSLPTRGKRPFSSSRTLALNGMKVGKSETPRSSLSSGMSCLRFLEYSSASSVFPSAEACFQTKPQNSGLEIRFSHRIHLVSIEGSYFFPSLLRSARSKDQFFSKADLPVAPHETLIMPMVASGQKSAS